MTEKKMKTKTEHPEEAEQEPENMESEGVKEDSSSWGGMLTSGGGITVPPVTWAGSITPTTSSTITAKKITVTPTSAKPKPSRLVSAPGERPKKILIAFLDGDDEVQWCAKVHPDDIDVTMSSGDPATRLNLGVWLIEAE
jgi:hypothetical protein